MIKDIVLKPCTHKKQCTDTYKATQKFTSTTVKQVYFYKDTVYTYAQNNVTQCNDTILPSLEFSLDCNWSTSESFPLAIFLTIFSSSMQELPYHTTCLKENPSQHSPSSCTLSILVSVSCCDKVSTFSALYIAQMIVTYKLCAKTHEYCLTCFQDSCSLTNFLSRDPIWHENKTNFITAQTISVQHCLFGALTCCCCLCTWADICSITWNHQLRFMQRLPFKHD